MKRKAIAVLVLLTAITGGTTVGALAELGPGMEAGPPPPRREMSPGGFLLRMAKVLKLSDAQQIQIKAIFEAEREQNKPLMEKIGENRKLLMKAAEATTFDEAYVRGIAVANAQIETELVVSRTKVQSRINALLTAEQLELAKSLMPESDHRPPPPAEN